MNRANIQKYLPHIAVALTVLYLGYQVRPRSSGASDFNFHDFGRIPVYGEGRYKPMDSVARANLMIITHRQAFHDGEKTYPATKWLLDVQTTPLPSDDEMRELCPNGSQNRRAWQHK